MKGKLLSILALVMVATLVCQVWGATPPPPPSPLPIASFTATPVAPVVNQSVQFTDTSTGNPATWTWSFGDGSSSTLRNPAHIYAVTGTYTVTLKAVNASGTSIMTRSLTVKAVAPAAAFTYAPAAPVVNQVMTFTDTSTNSPTSWAWTFGDNSTSTLKNPTHAYATAGTFTVTIKATNTGGTGIMSKSVVVKVLAPVVSFSFSPTAPTTGQTVTFADTSTNTPTSWAWTFGDGSTSTVKNPTHPYATAGAFTVTLKATNAGGTATLSKAITVTTPAPVASFSFMPTAPTAGQTVTFADTSTNTPTSWAWTFGDGSTSAVKNPTHAYATAGAFTVTLKATNAGGTTSVSKAVTVTTPAPVASFDFSPAPTAGQTVTFTDSSTNTPTSWAWTFGDGGTSTIKNPTHVFTTAGTFSVTLKATNAGGSASVTKTVNIGTAGGGGGGGTGMTINQTISDQAQAMTIAFDGLAFVTGSFCAQTFYPPGKVADFFGFQYLRDNDPSAMGHNTDFTTLTADPILVLLNDAQLKILSDLGTAEAALNDAYGYARFPLAKAFRRLNDGDLPSGKTSLSRDAVKAYSAYLFSIDGEMSYLRAQAYAGVLSSLDATQRAALAAMKGKGSLEWTQPTQAQVAAVLARYPGQMMRTYAGEMLAWYLGTIDADVYFCPERQGTYFGSFFMKDIKAMNNPSYTIDSNMTANMGDAFLATLDTTQKAVVTGLVAEQKTDLLSIVAKRDDISTTLRNLLNTGGTVDKTTVVNLARQYGELDGDISYLYASRFSTVGASLTSSQKTTLTALRKTATAEAGGSPDYDTLCGNGYLYSAPLMTPPVVMNTDFMFGVCGAAGSACSTAWDCCSFSCSNNVCGSAFTLTSPVFVAGGTLPGQYTCDGTGGMLSASPPLAWTGAPAGTVEYALTISTIALDGTKWNWVLYNIPASVTSLAEGTTVGTAGVSTDGPDLRYYPPCSSGPGVKSYTFTLYALSGTPTFSVPASQVTGEILTSAISPLILGSSQVNVSYTRTGL